MRVVKMRVLVVAASVLVVVSALLATHLLISERAELRILHAGSLTEPLKMVEAEFEHLHPDVDVRREAAGSGKTVRKVTELGKAADVVAIADFSIIPKMMFPEHADWCVQFACNKIVLAYTERSRYAGEVNETNWFEVLRREDVRFGFSNPNDDPCGYRAVTLIQLAELYYNDSQIFDDLVEANTAIRCVEGGEEDGDGNFTILVPRTEELNPSERVRVPSMEMELIAALETGDIDYYFIYKSVAVQNHQRFVELPPQIDLSDPRYMDIYKRVRVSLASGEEVIGKPIIYGVTVPKNAEHKTLALEFVKFLLSSEGRKIFEDAGQPPLVPAVGIGNVPEELGALVAKMEV